MEKKTESRVENITLKPVPASERKPWHSIAFIWSGSVICIPALMVGGYVTAGLNFGSSIICMIIGYLIVVTYMTLLGCQSSDLGVPTTVSISRAYGERGSGVVVSIIIAVSMTGWFAYQTSICASSFNSIMSTYFNLNLPLWLSCAIWGTAMFITAVYGVGLIKILNYISVPALFIMLIWGVISTLSAPGAIAQIASYEPTTNLGWIYGITMSVSGFAAGAICAGDYTRYCKSRRDTLLSSVVGVLPAGVGALAIGGVLAVAAGSYDLTVVFSNMGLPILGMLVLILATWTTNTGNAYSSGIAVVNIFKLPDNKRSTMTLVCGAIGTLLAMVGVIDYFVNFLNLIGYFVPPVAGVAIADYWVVGRGKVGNWKQWPGVNWIGIVSWLCGAATAYFSKFFVPTVNGIVVAILVYVILANVVRNPKLNPFAAAKAEGSIK